MIDKEKLLKKIDSKVIEHGHASAFLYDIIKNFPEEQPIDFDALYEEFLKKECDNKNCHSCKYNRTGNGQDSCFAQFLKSKNLTQPQVDMDKLREQVYFEMMAQKPVLEIPMKEVYRIKENYRDFCFAFAIPYSDKIKNVVKNDPRLKYCDITKMPDYSKIPKGSIVECVTKTAGTIYDKIGRVTETQVWFNHYSNIAMSNIVSIRIVELAKE